MNIIKNIIAFAASTFVSVGAIGCNSHREGISTVDATEFAKEVASEDTPQLVDVRTPAEFADGHLPGAINIDIQSDSFDKVSTSTLSRDKPVYVYCRSGKRSLTAADHLVDNGYKVVNLKGGILEWNAQGMPLATSATDNDSQQD